MLDFLADENHILAGIVFEHVAPKNVHRTNCQSRVTLQFIQAHVTAVSYTNNF